jgi:hypothetical protein
MPVINAVLDKSSSDQVIWCPVAPTQARVCGPPGQQFNPLHIATGRYTSPTKMHAAQIRLETASSYRPCLQSRARTLPNINVIPACASVDFAGPIGSCEQGPIERWPASAHVDNLGGNSADAVPRMALYNKVRQRIDGGPRLYAKA